MVRHWLAFGIAFGLIGCAISFPDYTLAGNGGAGGVAGGASTTSSTSASSGQPGCDDQGDCNKCSTCVGAKGTCASQANACDSDADCINGVACLDMGPSACSPYPGCCFLCANNTSDNLAFALVDCACNACQHDCNADISCQWAADPTCLQ